MDLKIILTVLGSILVTIAIIPYIVEILKGKTKPRVVSWAVWVTTDGIAAYASFVDHYYPATALLFTSMILLIVIVILGWKKGDKSFEKLDIICFIGATISLLVWWFMDSPSLAVLVLIVTEVIGTVPTVVHSWKKPQEEAWSSYLITFIGAFCMLLTVSKWEITEFAYPLEFAFSNLLIAIILLSRGRYLKKGIYVK